MVVISWASFLIPWNSYPGRFGLLVGLVICLINTLLNTLSNSPNIVGVNAIATWIICCIFMISLAIIEYSGLLFFIQHKNKTVPFEKENRKTKHTTNTNLNKYETSEDDWISLNSKRKKIDALAIVVIPVVFLIGTLVYMFFYYNTEANSIDPQITRKKIDRLESECNLMLDILNKTND